MNVPLHFDVEAQQHSSAPKHAKADFAINVRDRRFGRDCTPQRWWLNNDPVATAWHIALSSTFPRGEAMFIQAVKEHREGASDQLAQEIRAFVKQEINHTREHLAFNQATERAGYDLSRIDSRTEELVDNVLAQKPIVWLGLTIALEHFTAMFAYEFLANQAHFANGDSEQVELWRWHAAEEIEHKGVAYDTWLHATRDWSRWMRWKIKTLLMLNCTKRFLMHRTRDALDLLAQDGITGWRAKLRLFTYLFGKPGIIRRVFPAWCAYFLPGFHPWNADDRHLIARYDSEYKAANLSAAE